MGTDSRFARNITLKMSQSADIREKSTNSSERCSSKQRRTGKCPITLSRANVH